MAEVVEVVPAGTSEYCSYGELIKLVVAIETDTMLHLLTISNVKKTPTQDSHDITRVLKMRQKDARMNELK